MDPGFLPFGEDIGLRRQRPKRGPVQFPCFLKLSCSSSARIAPLSSPERRRSAPGCSTTSTPASTLALSRGLRTRAGKTATPYATVLVGGIDVRLVAVGLDNAHAGCPAPPVPARRRRTQRRRMGAEKSARPWVQVAWHRWLDAPRHKDLRVANGPVHGLPRIVHEQLLAGPVLARRAGLARRGSQNQLIGTRRYATAKTTPLRLSCRYLNPVPAAAGTAAAPIVAHVRRQRPAQARRLGTPQILAHRRTADAATRRDPAVAHPHGPLEPQHLSDLAHR